MLFNKAICQNCGKVLGIVLWYKDIQFVYCCKCLIEIINDSIDFEDAAEDFLWLNSEEGKAVLSQAKEDIKKRRTKTYTPEKLLEELNEVELNCKNCDVPGAPSKETCIGCPNDDYEY